MGGVPVVVDVTSVSSLKFGDPPSCTIRAAIEETMREGKTVTRDLGGTATTDQFTDAIIARL